VSAAAPEPQHVAPLTLETPLPLRLLTERDIAQRAARLARAQEAARRLAGAPPAPAVGPFDVVQRLVQEGAPPEKIDRARRAIEEDQHYARDQAARASARAVQLRGQVQQIGDEQKRRSQLTPAGREAEDLERARRPSRAPFRHPAVQPPHVAVPPAEGQRRTSQGR
jgi:hypothetical protein